MAGPVPPPKAVIDVGKELVIVWEDGREDYLPSRSSAASARAQCVAGSAICWATCTGARTGR